MKQLPLIDAGIVGVLPVSPALDPATIRALRQRNVLYLRTEWSAYWGEWQHWVMYTSPRGNMAVLVKNDAGIAAMVQSLVPRASRPQGREEQP